MIGFLSNRAPTQQTEVYATYS